MRGSGDSYADPPGPADSFGGTGSRPSGDSRRREDSPRRADSSTPSGPYSSGSYASGGYSAGASRRIGRRPTGAGGRSASGSTGRRNPFTNVVSGPGAAGANDPDEGRKPERPIGRRMATGPRREERRPEDHQAGLHRTGEHRISDLQPEAQRTGQHRTGEHPTAEPATDSSSPARPRRGRRAATPSAEPPVSPVRPAGGRRAAFPLPDVPGPAAPQPTRQGPGPDASAPRGRRARFLPPSPSTDQVPDESDEDDFPPLLTGRPAGVRRPLPADVPLESEPAAPTAAWEPPPPTGPDDTRARGRRRRTVEDSPSLVPNTPNTPSAPTELSAPLDASEASGSSGFAGFSTSAVANASAGSSLHQPAPPGHRGELFETAGESRTRSGRAGQDVAPEPSAHELSGPDPFADFPRLPGYADLPGPGWSPDAGTPTRWEDLADPLGAPGPDLAGQHTPGSNTPSLDRPGFGIPGGTAAAHPGTDPEPTVSGFRPDFGIATFEDPLADPPSSGEGSSTATPAGVTPDRSGIGEVAPDDPVPTPGRPAGADAGENPEYPDDLRPRRGRRAAEGAPADPRADRTRPDHAERAGQRGQTVLPPARAIRRRERRPRQSGMSTLVGVIVGLGGSAAGAALDLVVTGGLGVLFSLCFVLTAFGVAAGIRRSDVFAAGVLPPLSALATFAGVGALAPERLSGTSSHLGAVLSGLAAESWTLVAACALVLGTIGLRVALGEAPPEVSAAEPLEDPSEAPGAARRSDSPRRS